MDLSSLTTIYDTLARLGFPGMMFLVLVGSYLQIWEWSKAVRAREVEAKERELAHVLRCKSEIEAQQRRIDQLIDKVMDASRIVADTARQVAK